MPRSWQSCDRAVRQYVTGFVDLLRNSIADRLVGVYLHGSLSMNSYFPPKSDLDLIIVVGNGLGPSLAKSMNLSIAQYAQKCPTLGNIECSMITLDTAKNVPDEMPYELHYSEAWHQQILDGQVAYAPSNTDPDLPAHLMCVKKRGICLYGQEIDAVFGDVSWKNFIRAVLDDFDWIVDGENICESPYYGTLNLCRVLQLLKGKHEQYLSKYEGALWGIANLPAAYAPLIQKALDVYISPAPISSYERKTGGVSWDKSALLAFRDYAIEERAGSGI